MLTYHNSITKSAAQKLFSKVESAASPVAVFVSCGSWKSTKITTDLFRQLMNGPRSRELMGIYDVDCRIDWLEDDLAHAGVK